MTQEIIYTSSPRGLRPGSRGFCTVASTPGMAKTLAERLESLSGYRHVFPPTSPSAAMNPVAYSHLILSVGGQSYHILSRVADAGLDYSQRTNKLAHHIALMPTELNAPGPAWSLGQSGLMETVWSGDPRILPSGRALPGGMVEPSFCNAWQQAKGDAGWAGVVAEAMLDASSRKVYLIYRPGMEVLPLLAEVEALLPEVVRWQFTFSTYYANLPPDVNCRCRCVLADSPDAIAASRQPGVLVVDLQKTEESAPQSAAADAARNGTWVGRMQPVRRLPESMPAQADSLDMELMDDPNANSVAAAGPKLPAGPPNLNAPQGSLPPPTRPPRVSIARPPATLKKHRSGLRIAAACAGALLFGAVMAGLGYYFATLKGGQLATRTGEEQPKSNTTNAADGKAAGLTKPEEQANSAPPPATPPPATPPPATPPPATPPPATPPPATPPPATPPPATPPPVANEATADASPDPMKQAPGDLPKDSWKLNPWVDLPDVQSPTVSVWDPDKEKKQAALEAKRTVSFGHFGGNATPLNLCVVSMFNGSEGKVEIENIKPNGEWSIKNNAKVVATLSLAGDIRDLVFKWTDDANKADRDRLSSMVLVVGSGVREQEKEQAIRLSAPLPCHSQPLGKPAEYRFPNKFSEGVIGFTILNASAIGLPATLKLKESSSGDRVSERRFGVFQVNNPTIPTSPTLPEIPSDVVDLQIAWRIKVESDEKNKKQSIVNVIAAFERSDKDGGGAEVSRADFIKELRARQLQLNGELTAYRGGLGEPEFRRKREELDLLPRRIDALEKMGTCPILHSVDLELKTPTGKAVLVPLVRDKKP